MTHRVSTRSDSRVSKPFLNEIVEAFETVWNRDDDADVEDFFPDADHPDFEDVALELLCVDLERRWYGGDAKTVEAEGRTVHLTGKEYQMLELLSLRKGTTLTKEMFLNHLYGGMDEPELKIIDVFVCKLRKKLSAATGNENYIETVWGRGYVLRDPQEEPGAAPGDKDAEPVTATA